MTNIGAEREARQPKAGGGRQSPLMFKMQKKIM